MKNNNTNNIQNKILTYPEIKNTIFRELDVNLKNVNPKYLIDNLDNVRYTFGDEHYLPIIGSWKELLYKYKYKEKKDNYKWEEVKIIKKKWIKELKIEELGEDLDIRDWRKNLRFLIKNVFKDEIIYSIVIWGLWFDGVKNTVRIGPHIIVTNEIDVDSLITFIEGKIKSCRFFNKDLPKFDIKKDRNNKLIIKFEFKKIKFLPIRLIGNKKIYLNNLKYLNSKSINNSDYNILKVYKNIYLQDKFSIDFINIFDELYEKFSFNYYRFCFLFKPDVKKYDIYTINKRFSNYSEKDLESDYDRILFLYKKYGFLYSCVIKRSEEGLSTHGYSTYNFHSIIEKRKMAKFVLKSLMTNINFINEELNKQKKKFEKADKNKEIMLIINGINYF
jgi:hypothetical protein